MPEALRFHGRTIGGTIAVVDAPPTSTSATPLPYLDRSGGPYRPIPAESAHRDLEEPMLRRMGRVAAVGIALSLVLQTSGA